MSKNLPTMPTTEAKPAATVTLPPKPAFKGLDFKSKFKPVIKSHGFNPATFKTQHKG